MPEPATLQHRIAAKLPYLSPAMRTVAEFVLEHPGEAQSMTITQLAARCGVAESTISRLVAKLDLESFQALKLGAAQSAFLSQAASGERPAEGVYNGVARNDEPGAIIAKIARSSEDALRRTAGRLDGEAVAAAVALIERADTLVFCCMGSSSLAAEDGVMRFTRAGRKCLLARDQSVQVMTATILSERDLVIGISDSGASIPVVDALRIAKSRGASTIALTSVEGAPLLEHADVALFTSGTPGEGLYGEAVTSKWGQVLVMDVLYAAYAARHYDETLAHLRDTYEAAIQASRRPSHARDRSSRRNDR